MSTGPVARPLDRKNLRQRLRPVSSTSTARALALVALDATLFVAAIAGTVLAGSVALKLLLAVVAGFLIGRLFILGHDACHQSFTPHKTLNRWLGRIVFLPSLTPYSLWEAGHNVMHHGYTNLKGADFVWTPHTIEEYRALTPGRRFLYRVYRSGWAPWLYYLVEMWWLRMYFPSRRQVGARRRVFMLDGALVSVFALAWIGALALVAEATRQSIALLLTAGFAVPFLFWNGMIGFVVYLHHTHEQVGWHAAKAEWMRSQPFVHGTVHLSFRPLLGLDMGALLHHIMEHTAHHVDMGIPLYRLKRAQALLETLLPGEIVRQTFSWRWYFDTARRCKLYDFRLRCWADYAGVPTSTPAAAAS